MKKQGSSKLQHIESLCVNCNSSFKRHKNDGSYQRHRCFDCRFRRDPWVRQFPLAYKATLVVMAAIRKGVLPRLSHIKKLSHEIMCVDCGAQAQCWDHRDYRKPLDVDPVCHRCNILRGKALPYSNNETS